MKQIKIRLSSDAERTYSFLIKKSLTSKKERTILNAVNQKIKLIKLNPHYGNPIAEEI